MPSKILLLGESGGGKTTSLRNLDPKKTGFVNIDYKELPFKGWRNNYKTISIESGEDEGLPNLSLSNYVETTRPSSVLATLETWEVRPDIETIVLDTVTHLITADYMLNAVGKDYSGYQKMGKNFYRVIEFIQSSKKNVIVLAHIEKKFNDMGDKVIEMKSHGKMISDLVPPSYFTTVLQTHVERKDNKTSYQFRTQSEGPDPVKSPAHVTGTTVETALNFYEPNDMQLILQKLEAFEKAV